MEVGQGPEIGSSASKNTNKQQGKPKSRSGCRTCKEKRLKCDETRPACVQCLKRRLACPGYQQTFKWHLKGQTNSNNYPVKSQKKRRRGRSEILEPEHQLEVGGGGEGTRDELNLEVGTLQQFAGHSLVVEHGDMSNDVDFGGIGLDVFPNELDQFPSEDIDDLPFNIPPNPIIDGLPIFDWNSTVEDNSYSPDLFLHPTTTEVAIRFKSPQIPFHDLDTGQSVDLSTTGQHTPNRTLATRRKGVRSLLKGFYGMQSSVPATLTHQTTRLVEYYFSTISGLYACFDSDLNPFRSVVGHLWTGSASMYYAMQSMAAAHLANDLPSMRKLGIDLHHQSSQSLGKELHKCYAGNPEGDQALLTLLLLGLSACWQRPGDLGLPYLRTARALMHVHPAFNRPNDFSEPAPVHGLFEEALIYWEMLTSFVADQSEVDVMHLECENEEPSILEPTRAVIEVDVPDSPEVHPHPWTGISPQTQMLLARVGKLVRRVRNPVPARRKFLEIQNLPLAMELEGRLLTISPMSTNPLVRSGDHCTTAADFVVLAQVTRDCGLLELYRAFPDLLKRRLAHTSAWLFEAQNHNIGEDLSHSGQQTWLTAFAMHILRLVEMIPDSSNVRANQLLTLLIPAAELRLPLRHDTDQLYELFDLDLEISRARGFARARLNKLSIQLPAQPVRLMLDLLEEVWARMDSLDPRLSHDVFWVDVMVEKGWHTIMG